jgi:hypothetical protein
MRRSELIAILMSHQLPGSEDPEIRIATDLNLSEHCEVELVTSDDAYGPHFRLKPDIKPEVRQPAKPNRLHDFTIFGFNTGRAYTEKGQRISVGYKLDTNEASGILVLFRDHDRGIDGRLKTETYTDAKKLFLEKDAWQRARIVMDLYDTHHYQYHVQASWLDAEEFPVIAL